MSGKCCVCNDQCLIYSIQIRACPFSKLTAAAVRSCVWSACMNVGAACVLKIVVSRGSSPLLTRVLVQIAPV